MDALGPADDKDIYNTCLRITLRMQRRLVVFGGSGYIGAKICEAAHSVGWRVTCISRHVPIAKNFDEWLKADVFQSAQYRESLASADAVVHAIGSVIDDPAYKKIIQEPLKPTSLFRLAQMQLRGRNPLGPDVFARLNTDSAIIVAETLNKRASNVPFVYISAEDWTQLADRGYIQSKRRAEQLLSRIPGIRPIFLRPGFVANSQKSCWPSTRDAIGLALKASGSPYIISVDTVASAAIQAIEDPEIEGVVPCEALKELESAHI